MIRIAVCDDEATVNSQLEEYIESISKEYFFECEVDIFYTGEGLCDYLEKGTIYDLVFLDIDLKTTSGIKVGRLIRKRCGIELTQIVYISSKDKYALQLFKLRPLDFLIKPISYESVYEVMKLTFEILMKNKSELFEYSVGKYVYKYPINKILYFESINRKVRIHGVEKEDEFYATLKDIVQKVNSFDFIWIHKSFLVNCSHIIKFAYNQVTLSNGLILPIAQSKRKFVRSRVIRSYTEAGGANREQ